MIRYEAIIGDKGACASQFSSFIAVVSITRQSLLKRYAILSISIIYLDIRSNRPGAYTKRYGVWEKTWLVLL
jgi:hypothetical protein